ncbi:glycoside hydrolase family 9 protein [Zunongwangia sp.]|uniref:glycoside hydrolase family 9 protein n=1 Tax=Zunongwangia sp. TaxID=1965325 RepID=UPI003AA92265
MKNQRPIFYKFANIGLLFVFSLFFEINFTNAQELKVNDLGYFEKQGVNILVFSNEYNGMFFDEKTAGIELIQHGERTATGGAVRLQNTPEQWDLVPKLVDRKVDKENNSIEIKLLYEEFNFYSRVRVSSKGKGVEINVFLDEPLPEKLKGMAGFNLEFLPAAYFEKAYLVDGTPYVFPLYPSGNTKIKSADEKIRQFADHNTFDDRGRNEYIAPEPLASGNKIVLAPEDPKNLIKIESKETKISLFDGRNLAQNGWFIVRSVFPKDKTGNVLSWYIEPNAPKNWKRDPVIGFSQVGYLPEQQKVAVIELDKNDVPLKSATLYKINSNGEYVKKFEGEVKEWGKFMRYNYGQFDFSSVKEPGLYMIEYENERTNVFPIKQNVYHDIWHSTLDVWFPVAMDHMEVNEAYRTWHGVPFLDDALQAPLNQEHFDGYSMGDTTDTKYKPYEHIPGLSVGGWFDAGDFDIQTGSHCNTILSLVSTWEKFGIDRDETYINQKNRYVDIHRPDGTPDLLQQIEHGTLNLVAQVRNIGHPVRGIIVPKLHQYHHLGDASTETDNLLYDPNMKPFEKNEKYSGRMDDRWAFTERRAYLDYYTSAALAAASRSLKKYNDTLAESSLQYAKKLWEERKYMKEVDTSRFTSRWSSSLLNSAALQLYITTKEEQYAKTFKDSIWGSLETPEMLGMTLALEAVPYMDAAYKNKLRDYIVKFKNMNEKYAEENPYGVPITGKGWGGNGQIVNWATTNYFAHQYFPDIISAENMYKGLNYIFGCHPYSNISFVSGVGTRSKKVTYGNNRADFSFIAGGIVPGLLLLQPDFPENKENWPFLWGENEVTVGGSADYILLGVAAGKLSNSTN